MSQTADIRLASGNQIEVNLAAAKKNREAAGKIIDVLGHPTDCFTLIIGSGGKLKDSDNISGMCDGTITVIIHNLPLEVRIARACRVRQFSDILEEVELLLMRKDLSALPESFGQLQRRFGTSGVFKGRSPNWGELEGETSRKHCGPDTGGRVTRQPGGH